MDTPPSSYFGRMIGNASLGFSDLVKVGERIEIDLKRGRHRSTSSSQCIESDLLSVPKRKRKKIMQYEKLTRIRKLHLWCHIINIHMQRLFNAINQYLPVLSTSNRDKVHRISHLRSCVNINVNIDIRINVYIQTDKKGRLSKLTQS